MSVYPLPVCKFQVDVYQNEKVGKKMLPLLPENKILHYGHFDILLAKLKNIAIMINNL